LRKFSNKLYYSKEFSFLSFDSKGFTKVYKIPSRLDPNPNTHSFLFSLLSSRYFCIRNVIVVQYATPWPWLVPIAWSLNHVISPPIHLIILMLHIPIIISMQVHCHFLKPIAPNPPIYSCGFNPIIASIISSSFYTWSLPWFYLQKTLEEKLFVKYFMSNWPKSAQILIQFLFKISLSVQWSKLNSNPLD
jgi:hypothetical protein